MKTQVHTTISRRTLAVGATVVAGLCLVAPSMSAAMPGTAEYAVPAVMDTGAYLNVHPKRHVVAGKKLRRGTYLARHIMLAP
jgi:hypothetical protein